MIGPNRQRYYLEQFARFDARGGIGASWNWPAFFVTFFWLIYRNNVGICPGLFFSALCARPARRYRGCRGEAGGRAGDAGDLRGLSGRHPGVAADVRQRPVLPPLPQKTGTDQGRQRRSAATAGDGVFPGRHRRRWMRITPATRPFPPACGKRDSTRPCRRRWPASGYPRTPAPSASRWARRSAPCRARACSWSRPRRGSVSAGAAPASISPPNICPGGVGSSGFPAGLSALPPVSTLPRVLCIIGNRGKQLRRLFNLRLTGAAAPPQGQPLRFSSLSQRWH